MSKQSSKPSSTFRENRAHSLILSLSFSHSLSLPLFLSPYREKIDDGTEQQMANQLGSRRYAEKWFSQRVRLSQRKYIDMLGRYQSSSGVKRLCARMCCVCVSFVVCVCVCVLHGMWTPPRETGTCVVCRIRQAASRYKVTVATKEQRIFGSLWFFVSLWYLM